jgi:AcrR family transcriptional regulator
MAKSGPSSRLVAEGTGRSAATKRSLVAAAIETLKTEGFAGASARAIAAKAAECSRYGFSLFDHLVLVATGECTSAFLRGP